MLLTLMSALGCWLAISSIVSNCTEKSVLLRHSYFRTKENEKELSTNLRFLEYAGPQWTSRMVERTYLLLSSAES